MVLRASSSASTTESAGEASAAFRSAERTHSLIGWSPASAWMRSYSSGVTFVPIDFVRRDAMRGLLEAGAQHMQRTGRTWLPAVPVWEPNPITAANLEQI